MFRKNLLNIILTTIVVLSCEKTDTKVEQLDFETVLKSHVWIMSSNITKIGISDTLGIDEPFTINYTNLCDTNTLIIFNQDSTITKYINGNINLNCEATFKYYNVWMYVPSEKAVRFMYFNNGRFVMSIIYLIKEYSDNEVTLYLDDLMSEPQTTYELKLTAR